jgi:hypothetical protein
MCICMCSQDDSVGGVCVASQKRREVHYWQVHRPHEVSIESRHRACASLSQSSLFVVTGLFTSMQTSIWDSTTTIWPKTSLPCQSYLFPQNDQWTPPTATRVTNKLEPSESVVMASNHVRIILTTMRLRLRSRKKIKTKKKKMQMASVDPLESVVADRSDSMTTTRRRNLVFVCA